ncbi:uncharacterized protein BT62DRAFT_1071918 [Guyanagaster necrorhizus]|uniref:Uncharacterized protein n=1 Tax=Guyanagaster necrorhizus TaxID=856835 RepID=A0A9P7W2F3_9AGAR|nr:uncharacterized protein BT62DRAFT_1071918 [Guyanagaster necrorhizus MCA 3950]KAG7451344.1 hypothetical protein BT62DRAFT_1071918 [Guyanagaster necrorhizus MCA 3950]
MLALCPCKTRTSQIIFKERQSAIEFYSSLSPPGTSARQNERTSPARRRGKQRIVTKDKPCPLRTRCHTNSLTLVPPPTCLFPYDKFTCSGETPATLPAGSETPFTDATHPRVFIPWSHITAAFPEDMRDAIATSPEKFIAAVPFGAGPKFYAENRRADLLLKTFLEDLDFPDKGKLTVSFPIEAKEDKKGRNKDEGRSRKTAFDKPWPLIITDFSEDFAKFLLWNQCFANGIACSFQGNVVSNDPDLIAEALACIKAATWPDVSIQNLVKHITQTQGRSGNPAELTVKMTQSWRLSYIETKNFKDDKGPVFLLTREPITDNLDMHRSIAAHIRKLKIRVNYQQLINVDKIVGCDWCKNQNHPSHACPFPEVDSTWYGPSTDERRLGMMKSETPKDDFRKRREDSPEPGG